MCAKIMALAALLLTYNPNYNRGYLNTYTVFKFINHRFLLPSLRMIQTQTPSSISWKNIRKNVSLFLITSETQKSSFTTSTTAKI